MTRTTRLWLLLATVAVPLCSVAKDTAEAESRRGSRSFYKRTPRRAAPRRPRCTRSTLARCRPKRKRIVKSRRARPIELRTEPLSRPSGQLTLYTLHLKEETRIEIYGEDGQLDTRALATLDHALRCRRSGEERAFDPRVMETLSRIYDHFGQRRIEVVSGFRQQTNEGSRHFHAAAVDIRIAGVPAAELYEYVKTLDTGNMGIGHYPVSRFVHVDFRAPGASSQRWVDRSRPGAKHRPPPRRRFLRRGRYRR